MKDTNGWYTEDDWRRPTDGTKVLVFFLDRHAEMVHGVIAESRVRGLYIPNTETKISGDRRLWRPIELPAMPSGVCHKCRGKKTVRFVMGHGTAWDVPCECVTNAATAVVG